MQKQFRLLEAAALLAMGLCVLFSLLSFGNAADRVRGSVLRLHVVANSDSAADQALKLRVRDALLKKSGVFAAAKTKQQAEQALKESLPLFQKTARQVVQEQGFPYDVRVSLARTQFPTRTYGSYTLPAGTYDALRVVIGTGSGHNWWCVMFPPLCLPAACKGAALQDVLSEEALTLMQQEPQYEVRFWLLEQWEKVKERFSRQSTVIRH